MTATTGTRSATATITMERANRESRPGLWGDTLRIEIRHEQVVGTALKWVVTRARYYPSGTLASSSVVGRFVDLDDARRCLNGARVRAIGYGWRVAD